MSVLCRGPSQAGWFTSSDFDLLQQTFLLCIGCSDSEERHRMSGNTKALLDRLRASTYAAGRDRDRRKQEGAEEYLIQAENFLRFLVDLVLEHLHPGAPYRLLINVLTLFKHLVASSIDPRCTLQIQEPSNSAAISLAWPVQLDLASSQMTKALLQCLLSTFNDVRQAAMELLLAFPAPLRSLGTEANWEQYVLPAMRLLQNNARDSEAQSAALLASLYFQRGQGSGTLVKSLVDVLEHKLGLMEQDLALAAEQAPLHGTLASLSATLELKTASVDDALLLELLSMVERIFQATSPILASNSLEGTGVSDHEESRALTFEDDNLICAAGPRHKVMLSTSWRAVKEAAYVHSPPHCDLLTVGRHLMEVIMRTSNQQSALWQKAQVTWVSTLFTNFMLKVRHRGAFESIAISFSSYCAVLSSHPDPVISSQPSALLKDQLGALLSGSHLSTTRRSAGLPHFVLAILDGTLSRDSKLTDDTLSALLDVLEEPVTGNGERQVHAANIVRLLVLDTKLASRVTLQTSRAFVLAIRAFESPLFVIWIYRKIC